jgi:hypothetical protein
VRSRGQYRRALRNPSHCRVAHPTLGAGRSRFRPRRHRPFRTGPNPAGRFFLVLPEDDTRRLELTPPTLTLVAVAKPDGLTQAQLEEIIKPQSSYEGMRVWGALFSHRQACVRFLRDRVFEMLEDPKMTRSRLKHELADVVRVIEERGP